MLGSILQRRGVLACTLFAALAVGALPAHAVLTITPAGAAQGLTISIFASGFPNLASGNGSGNIGPQGIAFPTSGGVLVTDYPGNVRLFPTDANGQTAASAPVGQNYGIGQALGLAQV